MGHAVREFLWAQTWCALLVVSFVGWGQLILRSLAGPVYSSGLASCVGVAAVVFLGGMLNLLHLITGGVLIGMTLAGVGLAALLRSGKPSDETKAVFSAWSGTKGWQRLVVVGFVLLFLFRVASTTRVPDYPNVDDMTFYLAVPAKMMTTHELAPDPYSARRIEGSLGGSYFLQGLVMSALPLVNVQMADRYVGLVLLVLLSLALARRFDLSPLETVCFLIFSISIPALSFNLTFNILPWALWVALLLIGTDKEVLENRPAVQAFIVGLMVATLSSLKSIYLPHAALFCLALYLPAIAGKGWIFVIKAWAWVLVGALVVMLPWMIAMRATAGTFLYPVFGSGYDFSSYHQFPAPFTLDPIKVLTVGWLGIVPLAALLAVQLLLFRKRGSALVFLALTAAALLGTLAAGFATGTDSLGRYTFSIAMPTLVLYYLQFSAETKFRTAWKWAKGLQMTSFAILSLWTLSHAARGHYSAMWSEVKASLNDPPLVEPGVEREYQAINSALPKDAAILTTLQHPYLLDPLDQHVLLADWPGLAGVPPGWPVRQNGEALAAYLLGHGVRYLAYTYRSPDNSQLSDCLASPTVPSSPPSRRTQIQYESYLLVNKQYLELAQSRRKLYDDGTAFILDLATRMQP